MNHQNDIATADDIRLLVDDFYDLALADELLGPIFTERIAPEKWPSHKIRIYLFWETILLGIEDETRRYGGSPFAPHIGLALEKQHFDRWLQLFTDTVQRHFSGPKAEEAVWRAGQMAQLFFYKLTAMNERGNIPLI
ncbi:MAG: group III truncated hemoglobin [Bacteroidia bacterium]